MTKDIWIDSELLRPQDDPFALRIRVVEHEPRTTTNELILGDIQIQLLPII